MAGAPAPQGAQAGAPPTRRVLPPPKPPSAKMGPVAIVILVVVVLGVGGYLAYPIFFKPAAPPVSVTAALAPKPSVKPAALPTQPASPASTAAVVPPPPAPPVETKVAIATPAPSPVAVTTPAAPSPSAATPVATTATPAPAAPAAQTVHIDLPPAVAASPEFKAFIENMQVHGVFQGVHPRVLIGNNTYYVGDVINSDLGVVFIGIDPDRELAIFKDSTGVTLVKKY